MIRAHHQPHQVGHDNADEADGTTQRDGGTGGERSAEKRQPLRANHLDAPRGGDILTQCQQVQRPRQDGKHGEGHHDERQGGNDRAVVTDVEITHQPTDGPERLREVGHVLHEQDQGREERVERHAGQQQHVGGQAPLLRRRQPVDDADGEQRPGKAGDGNGRDAHHPDLEAERNRQHGSERPAGGNAQRERRGQGIAQHRLEHHARGREGRADQGTRQDAGQACHEEDLRVNVLLPRDGAIERLRQRDAGAAHGWRPQHDRDRADRKERDNRDHAAADIHRVTRRTGTTVMWPVSL